jgi:hypothetical protein
MSALWLGAACAMLWMSFFVFFCFSAFEELKQQLLSIIEQRRQPP